jgi:hypothetical protein
MNAGNIATIFQLSCHFIAQKSAATAAVHTSLWPMRMDANSFESSPAALAFPALGYRH